MSENTAELGLEAIRSHGRHLEVVPEIDDQHPQTEGVFLPEYDNGVVSSQINRVPELDTQYGKFWLKKLVMEDGVKYENVIGIPNQPSGATAIFTPA